MKQIEIEAIFTAKVTEYIQNGYTINTATMKGSESGEITKVDLRKGGEIIRVLLSSEREYGFLDRREYVALTVGRVTEPVRSHQPFDTFATIWNDRLEVIECRRFFQIRSSADYFTEDEAEYATALKKQIDRCMARPSRDNKKELPEAARKIAKRLIKRKTGKTRVSGNDIKVYRLDIKGRRTEYIAEYNGKGYRFA